MSVLLPKNMPMISKHSPAPAAARLLSQPVQTPAQPRKEEKGGGVIRGGPPIRADVTTAADRSEVLHNVMAAAAIARVCQGPSRRQGCRDLFPAAREGSGGICAIYVLERQPVPLAKAWGWQGTAEATAREACN